MLKGWFLKSENLPRWWKATDIFRVFHVNIKDTINQRCNMWPLSVGIKNIYIEVC